MENTRKFYSKINFKNCWDWLDSKGSSGYGRFYIGGDFYLAHRYSYILFKGDIPDGLVIDHLCKNKICVNPNHLEVVTSGENTRRGEAGKARGEQFKSRRSCPQSHNYTEENTIIRKNGGRSCRECQRKRSREYQRRKRNGRIEL